MRKLLVASAVALMAFAGQAVASAGIDAVAPQVSHADYRLDDRVGSGAGGQDQLTGTQWGLLLLAAGGVIAIIVVASDNGKSA